LFDRNRFNRDKANTAKEYHDNKEKFNKDCMATSDFVTSQSGRIVRDLDVKDVERMAEEIHKAKKNNAQEIYDAFHDEINTVYAIVKESINVERRDELNMLDQEKRSGYSIKNVFKIPRCKC